VSDPTPAEALTPEITAEPQTQPQQPTSKEQAPGTPKIRLPTTQTIISAVESASKLAAVTLVLTYVSGYLTISIYHASFGFTELNPLKPKILAAGVLFSFLTLIPLYASYTIFAHPSPAKTALSKIDSYLTRTVSYYYACSVAATGFFTVMSSQQTEPIFNQPHIVAAFFQSKHFLIYAGIIGIPLLLLVVNKPKLMEEHPSISIASAIFLLLLDASMVIYTKLSGTISVQLWFFGVGIFLRPIVLSLFDAEKRRRHVWSNLNFIPIICIFTFARAVYPKVTAPWGGGEPVPITLYMTKDSPVTPNGPLSALLLEETEAGFYIIKEAKSKAIFLPRAQVSMIVFSDKPLPPEPPTTPPTTPQPTAPQRDPSSDNQPKPIQQPH
jgi:hypothetical protein